MLEIEAGGTNPNPVTVAFNYTINNTGCPGCIDQLQVGLNTDPSPQTYAYNGGSFGSGSASVNINVPNTPGRYYIAIDFAEDYGFLYSSAYWANGQPTATDTSAWSTSGSKGVVARAWEIAQRRGPSELRFRLLLASGGVFSRQ